MRDETFSRQFRPSEERLADPTLESNLRILATCSLGPANYVPGRPQWRTTTALFTASLTSACQPTTRWQTRCPMAPQVYITCVWVHFQCLPLRLSSLECGGLATPTLPWAILSPRTEAAHPSTSHHTESRPIRSSGKSTRTSTTSLRRSTS